MQTTLSKSAEAYLRAVRQLTLLHLQLKTRKHQSHPLRVFNDVDDAVNGIFGEGFFGWFVNSQAEDVRRGRDALKIIGAVHMSSIVAESLKAVPAYAKAKSPAASGRAIGGMSKEAQSNLSGLESEFTAMPDGDYEVLLWQHTQRHRRVFPTLSVLKSRIRKAKTSLNVRERAEVSANRTRRVVVKARAVREVARFKILAIKSGAVLKRWGCRGDYSAESLWDVEDRVAEAAQRRDPKFDADRWMNTAEARTLMAYYGEVVRRTQKGEWKVLASSYERLPYYAGIQFSDNETFDPIGIFAYRTLRYTRGELIKDASRFGGVDPGPDPDPRDINCATK